VSILAEFRSYFEHVKGLRFDDRPDYDYLKRLFRELFFRKGFSYDNLFDWELLQSMGSQANTSGGGAAGGAGGGALNAGGTRMGGEFLQQTEDLRIDDEGEGDARLLVPGRPYMGIDEDEEGEPEGESREMLTTPQASRGGGGPSMGEYRRVTVSSANIHPSTTASHLLFSLIFLLFYSSQARQ